MNGSISNINSMSCRLSGFEGREVLGNYINNCCKEVKNPRMLERLPQDFAYHLQYDSKINNTDNLSELATQIGSKYVGKKTVTAESGETVHIYKVNNDPGFVNCSCLYIIDDLADIFGNSYNSDENSETVYVVIGLVTEIGNQSMFKDINKIYETYHNFKMAVKSIPVSLTPRVTMDELQAVYTNFLSDYTYADLKPVTVQNAGSFCPGCGKRVEYGMSFCPNCGRSFIKPSPVYTDSYSEPRQNVYSQPSSNSYWQQSSNSYSQPHQNVYSEPQPNVYSQQQTNIEKDVPSGGIKALGFFFPIVGLILYLVWNDTMPLKARSAGRGAIFGTIFGAIAYVILMVLAELIPFLMLSNL